MPWSLILTLLGAVVTTLLGVLVGSVATSRSQRRHWSRDRQMEACAQVLRESSNVLIELAAVNGRQVNPSSQQRERPLPGLPTQIDWRPWNEALAVINLVGDHNVVVAAHAIDAEVWPIHLQIKAGMLGGGEWFTLRDKIDARRREFVNVARQQLAATGPPLLRLTGRPTPDDPIWDLHRTIVLTPEGGQQRD